MTPEKVATELLERIAASAEGTIRIEGRELAGWPHTAVTALKSQRLIRKTRPAASVVCPGCEQQCVMPVHHVTSVATGSNSFIVCDRRDDINRIPVQPDRVIAWRTDIDAVCGFVSACLGLRRAGTDTGPFGFVPIGRVRGQHRRQMLGLRLGAELELAAGEGAVPLTDVLVFRQGRYELDEPDIRRLVDASATADARYTPNVDGREARRRATAARDQELRRAYLALKREHPGMSDVWYSRQIAKRDFCGGLSPETVRKRMKK